MRRVVRESALWGVIGGLLFAVLALGYRLATGADISVFVAVVVAVGVGAVTAVLSYAVDEYLG
ncbi:hypothetical protein [Halosegnis marinus]|uniref:DUF7981 domain-containing protein n=1 Tax=Halosegnis marinus TaxID=3034023 RepID=A0ABD5ZNC7_9EURY|nr:hypothetical protein [Halosegnis sp. DT85]